VQLLVPSPRRDARKKSAVFSFLLDCGGLTPLLFFGVVWLSRLFFFKGKTKATLKRRSPKKSVNQET
jgi:hypothetical protein